MSKSRKKAAARKPKKSPRAAARWRRRSWRLLLLLGGVVLGLMVPWVAYLNHQVTTEFEGRKWDLPSRVFARALELYPGAQLNLQDLEAELRLAGYRRANSAVRPGLYQVSGNTVEIYRRSFRFPEGTEEARRIEVRLAGSAIDRVRDPAAGRLLDLARLDPAEIA